MKKFAAIITFLTINFLVSLGTAGIPQDTATQEIFQAHSELLIGDDLIDLAFDTSGHTPELMPCDGRGSSVFGPRR